MKRWIIRSILILTLVIFGMSQMVFAAPKDAAGGEKAAKAKRTIMLYDCGSNLETDAAMASYNLRQILKSRFSADEDIRFIVMTGGSFCWRLDDDENEENDNGMLVFPEGVNVPNDAVRVGELMDPDTWRTIENPKSQISGVYNQLWEAKGADAAENAGKMVLLDGDGLGGDGKTAVPAMDEMMSDPETLKAFINRCVDYAPAEKYDLILWDHGGGPQGGYGADEHYDMLDWDEQEGKYGIMPFAGIVDALQHNKVTENGGKFDFVNFDACLMGSVELALVLADYTDYYIASADVVPGYGQYYGPTEGKYKGWLDELGDPAKDGLYNGPGGTMELGKVLVDDFYEFYEKEKGDGASQEGTFAIFDTEKLIAPETGFVEALSDLNSILKEQATSKDENGRSLFYDEVKAYFNSINYYDTYMFDLGDLIALLGVVNSEVSEKDIVDGKFVNQNAYTELSERFLRWFRRGQDLTVMENEFMYGRATLGENVSGRYYYSSKDEDTGENWSYGELFSTGMTIYFPNIKMAYDPFIYYRAMDSALEAMPLKDSRYDYLKDYEEVVADYGTILYLGRTVDMVIDDPYSDHPVQDKSEVTYDTVMDYLKDPFMNSWDNVIKRHLEKRKDGVEGSEEWVRQIIEQQIEDALSPSRVSASKVNRKNGEGYRITIRDVSKRIINSVERNIVPELPALQAYLDTLDDTDQDTVRRNGILSVGSVQGTFTGLPEGASYEELIRWYNENGGVWDIGAPEQKWYAVSDEAGQYHVASIYLADEDGIYVPAIFGTVKEGENEEDHLVMLEFSNEETDGNHHALKSIYYMNPSDGPKQVMPEQLTGELSMTTILWVKPFMGRNFCATISKTPFALSAENAGRISLEFMDVNKIGDIEDIDGDGKVLDSTVSITDFYGYKFDITDKINNPTDEELIDIELARVRPAIYNKDDVKELVPEVVYLGEILKEGVDYTWEKVPEPIGEDEEETMIPEFKEPGEYLINLDGKGRFTGMANSVAFYIVPPEEEAAQLVEDAKKAVEEARAEVNDVLAKEDASAEELKAAYDKLVKAQNTLTDALETLNRSQEALSAQKQKELENEIAGLEQDVQDLTGQLAEAKVIDISNYAATLEKTSYQYTGKAVTPKVKVAGLSAEDYIASYSNNVKIGTATVRITPINKKYKGEITQTFKITKRTNTLKVKGKTAAVKYRTLKKKNQTLKVSKVIKVTKKGQGKLTYKKVSGNKKITINKKTGKVTVKKGLKKGTYKVKVKVRAAGNKTYKASAWKSVTIRVKIK